MSAIKFQKRLTKFKITIALPKKSLNKTETPIFLSVVCSLFPKAIFLTFICVVCFFTFIHFLFLPWSSFNSSTISSISLLPFFWRRHKVTHKGDVSFNPNIINQIIQYNDTVLKHSAATKQSLQLNVTILILEEK